MISFYPRHPRGWRPRHGSRWKSLSESFYPRHPRGWRPIIYVPFGWSLQFLSTPPSRVATSKGRCTAPCGWWFLSTPPSRVATFFNGFKNGCKLCFYPRHPRGWRRTKIRWPSRLVGGFYPRHPRGWRRQKCTKMYSVFCAKRKKLSVKSKII